jgi:hypothetical protein
MGSLVLNGATSGSTTLTPTDAVTATLTLPSTSGTVLTTTSPKTGNVLQVVSTLLTSSQSTSSTSFVASNLVATITPSSSTSKILVLLNGGTIDSNTNGNSIQTAMYRNIASAGYSSLYNMQGWYLIANTSGGHSFNYLDSPSTTSSISYQPYFKAINGGTVWFNNSGAVSLTLMEIAA